MLGAPYTCLAHRVCVWGIMPEAAIVAGQCPGHLVVLMYDSETFGLKCSLGMCECTRFMEGKAILQD